MTAAFTFAPETTLLVRLRPMRAVLPLYALLSLAPALATGQTSQDVAARPAERFVGGWVGTSVAASSRFGYVTDRRFFVAALRAQFLLETFGPIALASTFDLVPLAVLSNTPDYQLRSFRQRDGTMVSLKTETGRSPVLGAGLAPAGVQLYTLSTRPARFFLGASGGALWFTRDTPVPHARRFNISAEGGGGVEILSRDGRALVVGYKFQHLSNAGTAPLNPGVDSHLVYVGVLRARGGRRPAHDEATAAR